MYRKDRSAINNKRRGGVALYVKYTLQSAECDELNSALSESVWCKVYADADKYFIVGICYPSPDADDCVNEVLFDTINLLCDSLCPILIMGDFNYPENGN